MELIKNRAQLSIKRIPMESLFLSALLIVAYFAPMGDGPSLCFFKFLGFDRCPGCGIGHAIQEALHFNFAASVQHHFMGIPAVAIMMYTIFKNIQLNNKHHGR